MNLIDAVIIGVLLVWIVLIVRFCFFYNNGLCKFCPYNSKCEKCDKNAK